jgi:hypothetical protein
MITDDSLRRHARRLRRYADVFTGAGDVNGDGRADIITSLGPGGDERVRVFDE